MFILHITFIGAHGPSRKTIFNHYTQVKLSLPRLLWDVILEKMNNKNFKIHQYYNNSGIQSIILNKKNSKKSNNHKKKPAFTIAEILIAVVVIGVLAVIILPNKIVNYQKKLTAVQLEKAYSILANAVSVSISKNGSTENWVYNDGSSGGWGNNAKNFYFTYLDEYLKVGQYCGIKHTEPRTGACKEIFASGDTTSYAVILENGIGLSVRGDASTTQMEIQLDINGAKGPNRAGRDGFVFRINTKDGLVPVKDDLYGMPPCTRTLKNPNGYSNWVGWGCAYVIMQNGWQITKDYPWANL